MEEAFAFYLINLKALNGDSQFCQADLTKEVLADASSRKTDEAATLFRWPYWPTRVTEIDWTSENYQEAIQEYAQLLSVSF